MHVDNPLSYSPFIQESADTLAENVFPENGTNAAVLNTEAFSTETTEAPPKDIETASAGLRKNEPVSCADMLFDRSDAATAAIDI